MECMVKSAVGLTEFMVVCTPCKVFEAKISQNKIEGDRITEVNQISIFKSYNQ